jgi:hypothetical protein
MMMQLGADGVFVDRVFVGNPEACRVDREGDHLLMTPRWLYWRPAVSLEKIRINVPDLPAPHLPR